MANLLNAIELEAAWHWYRANASREAKRNLNTRAKWFVAMKRINCTIAQPQPN